VWKKEADIPFFPTSSATQST